MAGEGRPWPPDALLAGLGLTRDEWDRMEESMASGTPPTWAILIMLKKAARRRGDELEQTRGERDEAN